MQLPELYDEILSHPKATDELRLSTESKLLRYKQKHLYSIPASDEKTKGKLLKELEELVQGAILLKRRDERTWCLFLDWQDYEDVGMTNFLLVSRMVADTVAIVNSGYRSGASQDVCGAVP
jgi:superkiller protein 3